MSLYCCVISRNYFEAASLLLHISIAFLRFILRSCNSFLGGVVSYAYYNTVAFADIFMGDGKDILFVAMLTPCDVFIFITILKLIAILITVITRYKQLLNE